MTTKRRLADDDEGDSSVLFRTPEIRRYLMEDSHALLLCRDNDNNNESRRKRPMAPKPHELHFLQSPSSTTSRIGLHDFASESHGAAALALPDLSFTLKEDQESGASSPTTTRKFRLRPRHGCGDYDFHSSYSSTTTTTTEMFLR